MDFDMAHQSPELMRDEDLQLLLIGKTGSGKSATGNTIFNGRVFESEMRSSSVTRVSQKHTGSVHNRSVTVIDTPDFIFSTHTDFDSDSELKRALELCSAGAHVILLVLPLSTFTEQEMDFISWFKQKFGEEALRFTLVLFTHVDEIHVIPLDEMIKGNNELSDFIDQCGQRYHEFNIKAPADGRQVTELMEKINRLESENTNSRYTLEMMQETERRREEDERRAKEERERKHQMMLDKVREETEIRVRREIEEERERKLEEWEYLEELEKPDEESIEKEKRDSFSEESNLPETSCKNQSYAGVAVGAVVGIAFGAAFGGVVGGYFVGGTLAAICGVAGGVIKSTLSGAESPSSLNKTEEAKSN